MDIIIKRASEKDSQNVGRLFDLYRQFYSYESNINLSIDYINERIQKSESVIFFARNDENQTMGFVQLYETFGSLDLGKIIVLYDLYVATAIIFPLDLFFTNHSLSPGLAVLIKYLPCGDVVA